MKLVDEIGGTRWAFRISLAGHTAESCHPIGQKKERISGEGRLGSCRIQTCLFKPSFHISRHRAR